MGRERGKSALVLDYPAPCGRHHQPNGRIVPGLESHGRKEFAFAKSWATSTYTLCLTSRVTAYEAKFTNTNKYNVCL